MGSDGVGWSERGLKGMREVGKVGRNGGEANALYLVIALAYLHPAGARTKTSYGHIGRIVQPPSESLLSDETVVINHHS